MDEPTNDLDVETLELLEELLGDYSGTLLLVSHDRDFIDNVVTSTMVMEGDGRIGEYVARLQRLGAPAPGGAGQRDWRWPRLRPPPRRPRRWRRLRRPRPAPAKRKLSYKDARELEQSAGADRNAGTAGRGADRGG